MTSDPLIFAVDCKLSTLLEFPMHINRALIPVVIIILLVAYGVYYVLQTSTQNRGLVVSGTIEATEVHLGTQMGGLVNEL